MESEFLIQIGVQSLSIIYVNFRRIRCVANMNDLHGVQDLFAIYRVSQELRSLLRDLIPELILSQKCHIHMGPIRKGSGVMSFKV